MKRRKRRRNGKDYFADPANITMPLTMNLESDGYKIEDLGDGLFLMDNRRGDLYRVDAKLNKCNCPFHAENAYCKHVLGGEHIRQQTAEMDFRAEAEANAECATGCDPYYKMY